ncbi:MAG: TfuA-like core protein [Pseudobdellovibrio sp.]|nr:TfuA-like core protein [Pseudobdellovibrio sp.]
MKIKIYSQLSIDADTIYKILPYADVSGPVQRGQVLRDIADGYNVIAIIDGQFEQNLAVTPSEVMDALRSGVRVYGSSSMGAMRAAECENYGATGYGKIFDFIKDSPTFRDDYLGQLFISRNAGWQTKTYMDFYFAAQDLVTKKKISKKTALTLCELYENLFYAERSEAALTQSIQNLKKGSASLSEAAQLIFSEAKNQKTKDAEGLLLLIKKDLEDVQNINAKIVSGAQASPDPLSFYPRDLYT